MWSFSMSILYKLSQGIRTTPWSLPSSGCATALGCGGGPLWMRAAAVFGPLQSVDSTVILVRKPYAAFGGSPPCLSAFAANAAGSDSY